MKTARTVAFAILLLVTAGFAHAGDVILRAGGISFAIDPATLHVDYHGTATLPISAAAPTPFQIADLVTHESDATWSIPDQGLSVRAAIDGTTLELSFEAKHAGDITWPIVVGAAPIRALILPAAEGSYVPVDDEQWTKWLTTRDPLDTTVDLSMPFVGVDVGSATITYLLPNIFDNEVAFKAADNRLGFSIAHTFRKNWKVKQWSVRVSVGNNSPVEPARTYRQYLLQTKQFVSLADKIKKTPDAEKLLGAAQAYIWGDGPIARGDVKNWKSLATQLLAEKDKPTVGGRIMALLDKDTTQAVSDLVSEEWPDDFNKGLLASGLSDLLERRDFYIEGLSAPDDAKTILAKGAEHLTPAEICRANSVILFAAYSDLFNPIATWGDGVSNKFLDKLRESGFDRMALWTSDWRGLRDRPEIVTHAKEIGYLLGPYDSYNGIHRHDQKNTWETSQFDDPDLYESGAMIKADGTKRTGFNKIGHMLSPIAARPAVEARVRKLLNDIPANTVFVDCDAFGQFYDDYNPAHPCTQLDDMNERLSRMSWIRDTFGAVISSEGGSSFAAPVIHSSQGIATTGMGWGDKEMSDRSSKYFLGRYYPNEAPDVFFKRVPLKDEYWHIYLDPRYRLPLFEVALHDSVINTHHWSFGSRKVEDPRGDRELTELLYGLPPLYHLNLAEFAKTKAILAKHYAFFSPLHRKTATLPMTNFKFLAVDQTVQQSTFGDNITLIANFGDKSFTAGDDTIPPGQILEKDGSAKSLYEADKN
jgi:hypothetical protein